MENMDIKTNLVNVISTLNRVEVKGRENMDHLLGCIMVLEKLVSEVSKLGELVIDDIKPVQEVTPNAAN